MSPSRQSEEALSYEELIKQAEERFSQAGVPDAGLDAWYLLSDTFQISRADYLWKKREKPEQVPAVWEERISRRLRREPLAYILGSTEFMGLVFRTEPGVLIPRQDTETLVEWILEECGGASVPGGQKLLDMCTGSGCIGLSLEKLGGFRVTLSDLSEEALKVARRNRDALGLQAGIFCGDLFDGLPAGEKYDIIVSNPPYICTDVIEGLQAEVREYEPHIALDGSRDGLSFYRRIAAESPKWLAAGARLYLEIGYDQGESVPALLRENGFTEIQVRKDLAGNCRAVRGVYGDV